MHGIAGAVGLRGVVIAVLVAVLYVVLVVVLCCVVLQLWWLLSRHMTGL